MKLSSNHLTPRHRYHLHYHIKIPRILPKNRSGNEKGLPKGELYISKGEAESRAHRLNEEYKSELAQSMKIAFDCWVLLKSDHSKEYNVHGMSANTIDCLSFGAKRDILNIEDVELITDKERIDYLENRKNELFNS